MVASLNEQLEDLGFANALSSGERIWADLDSVGVFAGLEEFSFGDGDRRVRWWQAIQETLASEAGVAFLVAVLGSASERESIAAAVALRRQLARIGPRRPFPPWRLMRLWDRLYETIEPWSPDIGWWGDPFWTYSDEPYIDVEDGDLQPWRPRRWTELYRRATAAFGDPYDNVAIVGLLVHWRLNRGLRSTDHITRALAQAAYWPSPAGEPGEPTSAPPRPPQGATGTMVSTMIHGTWAWAGDWWEPGVGRFHEFILERYRGNLYAKGSPFSWSGAYRLRHRRRAAERFAKWAADQASGGLQTVFAHSYGGDIAARAAVAHHARIDELILLSVPVTEHVAAAGGLGIRIADVRLHFDPVLALACAWQRFEAPPANVTQVLLRRWRLDHSATHRERVWEREDIAQNAGL
jgi:pimeloyl-ACP methyl ester carboxylesterase